jgi:hypothetical protein
MGAQQKKASRSNDDSMVARGVSSGRSDAELIEIAKSRYGLDCAVYPVEQAFAHLGVKPSYGFDLIAHEILPTISLGKRKTLVRAVDIARLLEEPPIKQLEEMRLAKRAARSRA